MVRSYFRTYFRSNVRTTLTLIWAALVATLAVLTYSPLAQADDGGVCDTVGWGDAAAKVARQHEASCLAQHQGPRPTVACLDEVIDIWWHCVGDYPEIVRVIDVQLGVMGNLDPEWTLNKVSDSAWLVYSIQVNQMGDGTRKDFDDEMLNLFAAREAQFRDRYSYYNLAVDTLVLVVTHKQYGSLETKKRYFARLKACSARMDVLWPGVVNSGLDPQQLQSLETQRRVVGKVIKRLDPTLGG